MLKKISFILSYREVRKKLEDDGYVFTNIGDLKSHLQSLNIGFTDPMLKKIFLFQSNDLTNSDYKYLNKFEDKYNRIMKLLSLVTESEYADDPEFSIKFFIRCQFAYNLSDDVFVRRWLDTKYRRRTKHFLTKFSSKNETHVTRLKNSLLKHSNLNTKNLATLVKETAKQLGYGITPYEVNKFLVNFTGNSSPAAKHKQACYLNDQELLFLTELGKATGLSLNQSILISIHGFIKYLTDSHVPIPEILLNLMTSTNAHQDLIISLLRQTDMTTQAR